MIIVDGFNVYPSEVGAVLYAHPAVRLAAVIGVPDAYHGEVVKACIALKPGATVDRRRDHRALPRRASPRTRCRGKSKSATTLPMSAVGKILYRVLRDEHAAASRSHDPRRSAPHHERPRILPQDAAPARCRRRR